MSGLDHPNNLDQVTCAVGKLKIKKEKVVSPPVPTELRTTKQVIHIPDKDTHFNGNCYLKAKKITGGESVRTLELQYCYNLEALPMFSTLRVLTLHSVKITQLNLPVTMKRLVLSNCNQLKTLNVTCKDLYINKCDWLRTIDAHTDNITLEFQPVHHLTIPVCKKLTLNHSSLLTSLTLPQCTELTLKHSCMTYWYEGKVNYISGPMVQKLNVSESSVNLVNFDQCVDAWFERSDVIPVSVNARIVIEGTTFGAIECSELIVKRCNMDELIADCKVLNLTSVNARLATTAVEVRATRSHLTGVLESATVTEFNNCSSVPDTPVTKELVIEHCNLRRMPEAPMAVAIKGHHSRLPAFRVGDYPLLESLDVDDTVELLDVDD